MSSDVLWGLVLVLCSCLLCIANAYLEDDGIQAVQEGREGRGAHDGTGASAAEVQGGGQERGAGGIVIGSGGIVIGSGQGIGNDLGDADG